MINFIGRRKIFFIISSVVILAGIVSLFVNGLNLDLEFKGGTAIRMEIGTEFENDDISEIVSGVIGSPGVVQKAGDGGTEVDIKTEELDTATRDQIIEGIKTKYSLGQEALLQADNVSASASTKIFQDAIKAISYAMVLMLLYIAFRFDFRSGVAAVVSLAHNVLVMVTVYTIFRLPVNSSFIAAVLTIVGYSINDTIVVFDRIRENRKFDRKTEFGVVANSSINQTLSRTINTSLTTLFTITALYVMGVDSIREFALPIIIGIIVGTYSSVCIASPLWTILRNVSFSKKKLKKA